MFIDIGMLGQHGLDINDPQESHVLRALPGRAFSELELLHHVTPSFSSLPPKAKRIILFF
jgi:hypothetical protein